MTFITSATYNSLRHQVAYCKLQGFDTISRMTSGASSLFLSGDVHIGAGLSSLQFGNGTACGMCFEVISAENFEEGNDELTHFTHVDRLRKPFIGQVFDQCTDAICQTPGFLDFDVYTAEPPVPQGNVKNVVWRPIPCPVHDSKGNLKHYLEYLFCNPQTCNVDDPEVSGKTLRDVWNPSQVAIIIRNVRVPIVSVTLNGVELGYITGYGWVWDIHPYPVDSNFVFSLTSTDGSHVTDVLDYDAAMDTPVTPGYRGGVVVHGHTQI